MDDHPSPRKVVDAGTFLVAFVLLAIVFAIAVPRWIEARRKEGEVAAIAALKTVATSQAVFREGDNEKDGNLDYGMLSELAAAGLVPEEIGAGTPKGYRLEATYSFVTSEFLWFAIANPEVPAWTGDRYFDSNQAGVIFYTTTHALVLDTETCSLPNGIWRGGK